VVLDEQHRELEVVAELTHERAELPDLGMVQPAGGLVEQKQARPRDERARELDALQCPERQTGDRALGDLLEADVAATRW
jgi:hypothetical protein